MTRHHPTLSQEFADAAEWVNHYHYRHGQEHDGIITWPSREAADKGRSAFFAEVEQYQQQYRIRYAFDIEARELVNYPDTVAAELPRDLRLAWTDDCVLSYAIPFQKTVPE